LIFTVVVEIKFAVLHEVRVTGFELITCRWLASSK